MPYVNEAKNGTSVGLRICYKGFIFVSARLPRKMCGSIFEIEVFSERKFGKEMRTYPNVGRREKL